jgi:hypothetical protein
MGSLGCTQQQVTTRWISSGSSGKRFKRDHHLAQQTKHILPFMSTTVGKASSSLKHGPMRITMSGGDDPTALAPRLAS